MSEEPKAPIERGYLGNVIERREINAFQQLCQALDRGQPAPELVVRGAAFTSLRGKLQRLLNDPPLPPAAERCRCMVCGNDAHCAAMDFYHELRRRLQESSAAIRAHCEKCEVRGPARPGSERCVRCDLREQANRK